MTALYQVGGFLTHRALDAWDRANGDQTTPILHLGDSFDRYNWTVRPTRTITELEDELVKKQAEKNKLIRIMYSGGSDSHSVAEAFARNRIPVVYSMISFGTLDTDNIDTVVWLEAKVRKLEDLHKKHKLPPPNYEFLTTTKKMLDEYFTSELFKDSSYYGFNKSFSLNQVAEVCNWSKWPVSKTLNVYGIEKPRLYEDDIGIYWQITDSMSMYGHSMNQDNLWFYMTDESLELTAKQCWNLIDYIDMNHGRESFRSVSHQYQTNRDLYFDWCQILERRVDYWWALMSKSCKNNTDSVSDPNNSRYIHLKHYQELKSNSWKRYVEEMGKYREINNQATLKDTLSKRFYLTIKEK